MVEVETPTVSLFMGDWETSVPNIARHADEELDTGLRVIMFTDLVGSTQISSRDGDAKVVELVNFHDRIVRGALSSAASAR
jgi:class 3 adenylate cyclase